MTPLCVLILTSVMSASAAPPTELRGVVLDPGHSPVAGALVTPGEAPARRVLTGAGGDFVLPDADAIQNITISKEGFTSIQKTVHPGDNNTPQEFVLELLPVRSVVTITETGGYLSAATGSATRTLTPLIDIPQSISVVNSEQIRDQMMASMSDVVRYIPGITAHQGENNRDQLVIRGNNTSADFFVDGVRDDVQYYRDVYDLERVEALKGPNALTFGRGGAGGVINRVTKAAGDMGLREISVQGGSFGNRRVSSDFNQPLGNHLALRLNSMFEDSGSFRDYVRLQRFGISPAATIKVGDHTLVTLNGEIFHDDRTADRGVPSWLGRPVDVAPSLYFGNPEQSNVRARVILGAASVEHQAGLLNFRNRLHFGNYDRGYQNFVPGAVTPDGRQFVLSAYNNATLRSNIFNQTDFSLALTGRVRHTLTGGAEVGRQNSDNFRNTGYFNNAVTSVSLPLSNPVTEIPVVFRQSATDADNHVRVALEAAYLQDQIQLTRFVRLIGGVRLDHFDLQYLNNRNGSNLRRIDNIASPRAGITLKPYAALSIYGSYSVSFLPSSGDQFSSLTTVTEQVKPEKFTNYEAGVKWEARNVAVTAALYRLDRTNTRSTDPNDPTRIVQTGSQRTNGLEAGVTGSITRRWKLAGGFSQQDVFVSSATAAARAGAVPALVPRTTFSIWNNYQFHPRVGAGLGLIHRSDMFASIDDTVVLKGYTRVDAALFIPLAERIRFQANVENVAGIRYVVNADNNNNISPGSTRSVRIGLNARF